MEKLAHCRPTPTSTDSIGLVVQPEAQRPADADAASASEAAAGPQAGSLRDRRVTVIGSVWPVDRVGGAARLGYLSIASALGGASALATWRAMSMAGDGESQAKTAGLSMGWACIGLAGGAAVPFVIMALRHGFRYFSEWGHLCRHAGEGPTYQLNRLTELAQRAAPLNGFGLYLCLEKIQRLHMASPQSLTGCQVASAIAELTRAVLPESTSGWRPDAAQWKDGPSLVFKLFEAIGDLHRQGQIDSEQLDEALRELLDLLPQTAPDSQASQRLAEELFRGHAWATLGVDPEDRERRDENFLYEAGQLPCLRPVALHLAATQQEARRHAEIMARCEAPPRNPAGTASEPAPVQEKVAAGTELELEDLQGSVAVETSPQPEDPEAPSPTPAPAPDAAPAPEAAPAAEAAEPLL